MTSHAPVMALKALVALSSIELGEVASALADRQEELKLASDSHRLCEEQMLALRSMHDRISAPGTSVQPALMSLLARQSVHDLQALAESEIAQAQASALVDEQIQSLHRSQSRHETLTRLHRDACRDQAMAVEHRESVAREDLYLMRRQFMGVGT